MWTLTKLVRLLWCRFLEFETRKIIKLSNHKSHMKSRPMWLNVNAWNITLTEYEMHLHALKKWYRESQLQWTWNCASNDCRIWTHNVSIHCFDYDYIHVFLYECACVVYFISELSVVRTWMDVVRVIRWFSYTQRRIKMTRSVVEA